MSELMVQIRNVTKVYERGRQKIESCTDSPWRSRGAISSR